MYQLVAWSATDTRPLPRTVRSSRASDLFAFWEGARSHFHFATKDWRGNGGTWFDRGSLQQSDLHWLYTLETGPFSTSIATTVLMSFFETDRSILHSLASSAPRHSPRHSSTRHVSLLPKCPWCPRSVTTAQHPVIK